MTFRPAEWMTTRLKTLFTFQKLEKDLSKMSSDRPGLRERYAHAMILCGVGDALGYKNGDWEFCHSGEAIFKELKSMGGLEKVHVKLPKWMVSDDTVMHLATAEALIESGKGEDKQKLFLSLAKAYKESMHDMNGRAAGLTCMNETHKLKPLRPDGYKIPFNPRGGGCGAAMRAMCIGLRYPRPEQLQDLVAVSVESGRMTHHHPTGFLGSLAAALFTAYAVQDKPPKIWGKGLMDTLPMALSYIESSGHCYAENKENWDYFGTQWKKYLALRGLEDGVSDPVFPEQYGFKERDAFVKSVSFSGWGGASGHDAPMIAYDAFLGANGDWTQLCYRSMFHAGDSDSTGVMAACWFGVTYGINPVFEKNHQNLEYRKRLQDAGIKLYALAYPEEGELAENLLQEKLESAEEVAENNTNKEKCTEESQEEQTMHVSEETCSDKEKMNASPQKKNASEDL